MRSGIAQRLTCDFEDAVDELDGLLRQAVRLRMDADVPLGAFLSGGVDSSTVVALMQTQSARPVQTFTIGFSESSHDEAPYARAVAKHLGTEHHEEVLTPGRVIELVPRVASLHDEPFADGSSVPTYLLSKFTRRTVTVALSGDGGDALRAVVQLYRGRAQGLPGPEDASEGWIVDFTPSIPKACKVLQTKTLSPDFSARSLKKSYKTEVEPAKYSNF